MQMHSHTQLAGALIERETVGCAPTLRPSNSPNRRTASSKVVLEIVRLYRVSTPKEGSEQYFCSIGLWAAPSYCGEHLKTSSFMLFEFCKCRTWASKTFDFVPDSRLMYHHYAFIFSNETWKNKTARYLGQRGNLNENSKTHNTISLCSKQNISEICVICFGDV